MADQTVNPDPHLDETYALRWTVNTIRSRMTSNRRSWDFYQGTQAEVFTDRRITRQLAQYGRLMRVNMARTPITAVLDRLQVESITTSLDQGRLDDMVADQDVKGLAHELHERAEAYGEAFALVWPDELAEEEDPDGLVMESADGVVITLHDPTEMAVRYDDEHRNVVKYAGRLWLGDNDRHRVNVYYSDRVERWVETADGSDDYMLVPETEELPAEWMYPDSMDGVPVFHWRTTRTEHGRPGHADAIPVQSILDKLVATDMAMVDYAGFPIRWAIHKGDPGAAAAYDDPELDDPDSTTDATEAEYGRKSKLKASPAAFWNLDADAVGEFGPADPRVILDRLNHYSRALLSVSDTPLSEWEGIGANQSGEAQRQEEKTLLRKVRRRQSLYGGALEALLAYTLEADGSAEHKVTVGWADPAETDDTDAWTVTQAKVNAGLPLYAALAEHGYTEDELEELGLAEDAGLAPDVLGRLVQQLASSIPVALDREDLRAILGDYGVTLGPGDGDDPELMPPPFVG